MQEVLKDGSEGKAFVEDTIEDLLPHIKKSLEDQNVKYVKVFRGKTTFDGLDKRSDIKKEGKFAAEEQRTSPLDELIEKCEEEDKKNKEEKKKAHLLIPRKK